MFLRPGVLDDDSDEENVASPLAAYAVRPSTASSARPASEEFDRPFTPATQNDDSSRGTVTTPAARMEKLRQQKLLQQQRMKQRAGAASMVTQKDEDFDHDNSALPSIPAPQTPASSRPVSSAAATSSVYSFSPNAVNRSSATAAAAPAQVGVPKAAAQPDSGIDDLIRERQKEQDAKHMSHVEKEMQMHGISPVFDPVRRQAAQMAQLDFTDMRLFCWNPAPPRTNVECYIVRKVEGDGATKMFPIFELYTKDDRFLMAAVKRTKNRTSNYAISLNKLELEKNSISYMGKLRSNFVGTEFVVYDRGVNPKDASAPKSEVSSVTVRQEMATVIYQSNILVSRGPRKMTVLLPSVKSDGSRAVIRPMSDSDTMLAKYNADEEHFQGHVLMNKAPQWNERVGAYVLNFNGRVKQASVKNFQLVDTNDTETIVLQFGKVEKDLFNMDFQFPMSAYQAFAICLSSFDYKLACE